MKPIAALLAAIALSLALPVAAQDLPDLGGRTIKAVTENAYTPLNFADPKTGEGIGWEYDAVNEIAKRLNAKVDWGLAAWDVMIEAVRSGQYDVGMDGITITDERKQQVDFTDKYYTNALNFVSMKGAPAEVTPEALAGKTLGAQSSTVSANVLEDKYKNSTIRLYPTQDEAYADLAAKRLDAVLADSGPTALWLKTDDANCCAFMGEPVVKDDEIGIAVRKEDTDLKEALNKALAAIIENGTYKKINEKYFPFSIY